MHRRRAGLAQHPLADWNDRTDILRDRDKYVGLDRSARRVRPAQQRLIAHDRPACRGNQRLEHEAELAAGNCVPKVMFEFAPFAHDPVHFKIEEAGHAASAFLGTIECDIGIVAELFGVVCVAGEQRHPDADTDRHRIARNVHFAPERVEDGLGQPPGVADIRDAALDDQELVTANPCDDVLIAGDVTQQRGDAAQDRVARSVTEQVVHGLEAVEIDREQREMFAGARQTLERRRQAGAIGQAGQGIMRRKMFHLPLGVFAGGQIANGQNLATAASIFDVMGADLDEEFLAIGAPENGFGRAVARRIEAKAVARYEPVCDRGPDEGCGIDAEQGGELAIGLDNATIARNCEPLEGRVGQPAQVCQQAVQEGADQRQYHQTEGGGDNRDDEPAMAVGRSGRHPDGVRSEDRRRHRREMEGDNAEDGKA